MRRAAEASTRAAAAEAAIEAAVARAERAEAAARSLEASYDVMAEAVEDGQQREAALAARLEAGK